MAGQGVATGKISLAVELIDNYKQIASQLKNGLKGNLKDYELDVGFNDKNLAEQAESELGKINELLSNSKFKDLDWSNVIPPLTQVLADGDLAESVKVQIIEGFRRGIEEIPYYYSSEFSKTGASKWEKIKPGEEIAQQILGASIFDEAIESFGMGKRDTQKFKAQYRNALGQHADETIKDIVQMMSNVSISTDYKDVMPYMIGGTASSQQVEDLWLKAGGKTDSFTKSDLRRAAALTERLKYIAKQNPKNEEQQKAYATAENRLDEIISAITSSEKGGKYTQEDVTNIIGDLRSKIEKASKTRDDVREKLNASQYEQKDIPALLSRLREMVQGERSKQIESTIQEYDKANTLDWDQLFNIIAPDEEPADLRYDDTVTNWLESLAEKTADNRSEEKKQRDDEARRKAQISQAFKNLLNTYGKTGVDSSAENIEGMVDPSVFTDKLEGDVDHLTKQRQEVEKQADELQRAKEELEKENTAIVDVINGNYEQKGVSASKKQLWEKQQAYDEADESNKDLAWIEYYKAYQNMVGGNNGKNIPSNLDKLKTWDKKESLAERLAREFGDEKEFNTNGLREHITNLKQRWIENSTELQNLLNTIAETESQKRAINEQIANIQAEESKPAKVMPESTPDTQEMVDVGQLEQQRKALEEELEELERQYQEQQELNSAIQNIVESINEGESATKFRSEAEIVLEHMYDSDNDVIRDLAQYWESSGETGASFGALESYGEDAQEKLDNLKEQIEARQEKVKEINETIRQMSPTSIEIPNEEAGSGETDEHATEEQLEKYISTYKNIQEKLKEARDEVNKILSDKDNFDPGSLFDHQNALIAKWAEDSDVITIDSFQEFADSLEQKISYWEGRIQQTQNALNDLTNQNGEIPTESLDESATRATSAVEGLSQAQQQGNQAGQQAADTAQNAANALRAEEEAANAGADAQDRLAASRQNANNAQPPSTPSNPAPAPKPETPPTHPETPVRTGNIDGINEEAGAAENAMFKFMSAAEAKEAFVAANKDANASAEETAKGIDKESQAAENAKLGFDPEKLQTAIDTTQKIHELLTQVSTTIGQMDNSSGFTGVTEQLKTVAEAMQLITESAQQVGSAMSAVQAEGGLKVDLQNGLDINPLIGQFETLNKEVVALVASLASVQSAIGAVDKNDGLPNLLTQIQAIANSLQTISQKDLGFNFNISNTGNAIQQQAAKDRQALKELRSQAESLEKYFSNNLGQNWEGMLKRDGGDNYFKTLWSTQDVLDDKKSTNEEKMEVYKRRIDDLKQYAIEAGADLQSILPKITQAPDTIIDNAKNFALDNSPTELIKQIFGGDNNAVLDAISGKIQEIIGQLNTLNSTLSSLSDGSNLTGLKEVFEQIPQKIEAATRKIFELKQQIDTAQFSQGFDEQFKGLTEQLEAAKEQTKATNEELVKTKKLLDEETQARKQLQSEVDKYKNKEANAQQKANAEEKKALETERNNLAKQLEAERKQRTEKAEAQNKKYLDEQIKQQNRIERDQLKAAEKAKKEEEKAQQKAADESLSKQYKGYSTDVKGALDAKSVQEIDAAAKHIEETKQRILSQASLKPEDNIFGAQLGDNFTKAASQQVESLKAIENAQASYVAKTIAEYEKQKSALEDLNLAYQYNPNDNTQKMQLLTNNPGEEIRSYVENVDNATMALERLKEIVDSMKNGTFNFMDASALKEVLQVREMLSQNVSGAAAGDKAYKAQIEAQKAATQAAKDQAEKEALAKAESATKRPIADLNKLEKDLEKIKADSEKLVVIDPALEAQLINVEQALERIRQIKQKLTDEPLKVFDTNTNSVTEQVKQDIESVTNTFKTAKDSITESKNLLASLPASFTGYGTAITKLFGEISNPKATTASIEAIYESIKTYTDRISMATNMQRPDFLTGILNENAPDKAVLNQGVALDKVTLGFERFHSQITHEAESTKRDLTKILGEDLFTDIIKDANFEGISGVFSQGSLSDKSFKVFKNDINSASESFKEFQKVAEKLQSMSLEEILGNPDIIEEYVTNLKGFEESLDHIKDGAKNFSIVDPSELQKQRAIYQKFLNDNPAISSSARTEMTGLISQLQTGINSFDASHVVQQLKDIANAEKEAGNTGGTFISMLTERFKSLGAYLLTFVSFYRVIGVFKDGINIIHELDDALTEMQKVSDESLASLKEYQKTTFATANDIGTTAAQLQQSTADWMRLGEDLQQASQSAQTANVLFNVSEFDNINDATTALVAMSAAYADAEKDIDKMDIVDRLNLIGNNYAIATDELATALQDGAATLQTAGNDLDEAIALTTAGNLITQDASKTGKGIRTIALRLTGTKEAAEELEEMGEDTSDMIMSQSKMRELIMNATKVASNNYQGFDIQDELGRYKSTYEIMLGLSQIWDEIRQADLKSGDNRQNLLLESIAGKNRASIAASILQNPQTLMDVYEDSSTKAAGSALKENEKVLQSITGHLARLKNAWQEMWANAANRDVINAFIDLATVLLNVINKVGLLGSAFAVVWSGSILKGIMTADSWLVKFVRGLDSAKTSGQGLGNILKSVFTNIGIIDPNKETRWKGLQQIQKDKTTVASAPTIVPTPTTTPIPSTSTAPKDVAESAAKKANADATKNLAQANLEQATSEEVLQAAQEGNIAAQTSSTAEKEKAILASQQAAQSNIQEAETAEMAAQALMKKELADAKQEVYWTQGLPDKFSRRQQKQIEQMAESAFNFDTIIPKMQKEGGKGVMDWSMQYVDGLEDIGDEAWKTGQEISQMGQNIGGIGATLASLATNPMTWLVGIPALIGAVNVGLSMWQKHQQALIDGAHEATNAWNDNKTSLDNYIQQYQDLHSQLDNVNLSEEEQTDIKKQLFDLQKQITDEYGHQADGVNLVNGQLDEQIQKLRTINKEQASSNLGHGAKGYKNAVQEIERQREYNIQSLSALSAEDFDSLTNGLSGTWKKYINDLGDERGLTFVGNALEAENALDELYERLSQKQDELGEEWKGSIYESLMSGVESAIQTNDETITKFKDDYNSYLEQSIYAQNGTFGEDNLSAGDVLIKMQDAVNDYNAALLSGDVSQIDKAKESLDKVKEAANEVVDVMGDERFNRPFESITDQIDKTAEATYNINKKMQEPAVRSAAESVFGKLAENKKVSKKTQDEVLDAAQEILDIQHELAEQDLTDIISPLYEDINTKHTTRFGNVDLANRPVLKWDDTTRQKYAKAWASWNTNAQGQVEPMPQNGEISTVLGTRGEFGKAQVPIAFTPMLNTGDKLEYLDKDTVYNYLNNIVTQATDKSGNVDMNKIFTLDADDPEFGKNLITAVGDTAKKYDKVTHYLGKDGAYTTAMGRLKDLAEQTNIPIKKMLASMRNLDNASGIKQMFTDTLPSVEDVRMALADTTGQFQELQDFAQQNFEITAETPDAEIQGFIEAMQLAGLVATTTAEDSQKSLDDFYVDVSNKINKINELTSIASKGLGQGGLSFTKLLDENKKLVESDVSKIVDSFQHIYDLDIGSLFEETATGIKLNMDAYRQLIQEEESATKLQFASQRKKLESDLARAEIQGASKTEINKIKEQITDLDMLAAAYDGATSATAKYLAQQNAADYGDSYEMFRDTTVKRADELMGKGMIGTEEFRTIAQLFSYDSLATASADKVLEAYQTGYNNVKKYLTEDATVGMQTFLDDLVALPEEYGKFIKNADGGYMLEFTEAQEDKLAEHLGVSKDMLESFYDMLNALGFDIHFFRDGTLDEFDKLNENIHNSQDRLKELKETANDKDLIPDDLFEVNADELNTVEELQNYLTELSQLEIDPEVNPEEYEAWQTLLDQIKQKIEALNSTSQNEDGSISIGDFRQADEKVKYFKENFENTIAALKEQGEDPIVIKAAIENDQEIKDFSTMLAQMPPEIQTYIAANLGINGFEPTNDPEQITQQLFGHLEQGLEIPAKVKIQDYYDEGHAPIGIENIEAGVTVNPTSEEAAKQEVADTIGSAEPDVGVHAHLASSAEDLKPLTTLGFNGEADFQMNLSADASQANEVIEETKEEATKETEMPLFLKAENTAQDAANQAGAQQGVQTTNHETTIKDEQINTTVTSDTSQIDAASQTVSSLKAMSGSNVSISLSVDGTENVEKAKDSIDNLTSQKNPKVKVTINGNSAQFNKTSSDITNKLNALGKKVTTPKISADNSRLSSKVSDSKSKLSSIKDKTARITASQVGFSTISSWKSSVYDKLSNKTITIKTKYTTEGKPGGGSPFQGSAHNQGTVISKGHAYASGTLSGDWGLPKAEKGALVNELGSEVIVTPDGHWQILNGGDPTFANLPKGSVIFNHKQSESLLKKGYINGSHGKMIGGAFANGTVDDEDFDEDELEGKAFATGTAKWNGQLLGMSHAAGKGSGSLNAAKKAQSKSSSSSKKSSGSKKKSSGSGKKSSGNSSSNKSSKDNLQTLDAIEIRLNRIDALISQLDTNAAKTYSTFANRNSALVQDLATVQKEINAINSSLSSKSHVYNYLSKASAAAKEAGLKSGDEGYKKGSQGASGTALNQTWIKRIQNSVNSGKYFTINDVRDEGLWKKIQAYQTWYEKYVKMQQKLQDQINKLSQLTIQQLTLIQTKWETTINNIGANITSLQNRIDLVTERGYDVAENYYSSQITENQNKIKALTSEASELQAQLNAAVKAGRIQQYSEEWYKWYIQIKNINNEVIVANKEIQSLVNSIRQLRWDKFERGQDELSNLADEMEFLGDLINEIDLFDKDTGLVTDKGKAAFALEAQRYDIYIKQAKKYGEAVKRLNADIAKDPNNKTLIDQRNEWLKAQQDAISNAHSQKEAIADLVEKGIKKQIEVMEDLIDKYEDALDAEKEQQKYAESIAKKQKEINSLQKQLKSMEGDDSEEGATKRQKLRDQLKEAQKDLEDTQEDQRISDIKDALSTMQEKYEEVLNARLDNIDALLTEVVSGVNQSGADIVSTLKDVASSVDYSLSGSLNNIYTGVQNLSANVANVAGQVGALVTATSTSNGSVNNASATTYAKTPTPTVPTTPTVADYTPKPTASSSTGSGSTAAKSTTTPAKTTAKAKNGLITEGGQTYYYKNNKKQTGWQTVGGKKYYFSTKNGAMLKDVQKIGNTYYLLDKTTGALRSTYTGLYKTGNSTYYFKSGAIQTGWRDMKEGRRYFSVNSGKMLTGKQKIGNDEYYFNSNGILQIGKFNVDGYTFETDKNGKIKKKVKAAGGNLALKGSSNNSNKAVSTAASKGLKIQGGFAKGAKNVNRAGMYRVDEEGQEVFINKNGKIYTRLDKGTAVLPHDAAVNLLKGMSNPVDFIASHMDMRPNKNITNTNNTTGDVINNITFNIPNVTNYKEFMQEAQRDPNFTKYIQELSIGRLNGNNSLKGNSIRFR